MNTEEILSGKLSLDMKMTEATKEYVIKVGKAINDACDNKAFSNLRKPIIAGGSIRDMVFGLEPKDIDVFVDLSSYEDEDEREDTLLLFADEVRKSLVKNGMTFFERDAPSLHGDGYTGAIAFEVYNLTPMYAWEGVIGDFDDAQDPEDDAYHLRVLVQIIGKTDKRLSSDPFKYIQEDFDYSFVKMLYDPSNGEFLVSDEFVEDLSKKDIVLKDVSSYKRAIKWNERYEGMLRYSKNKALLKVFDFTCEEIKKQKKEYQGLVQEYRYDLNRLTTRITNVPDGELVRDVFVIND